MARTKIICTIGPATENVDMIKDMIKAGMNVARINFSHGNIEDQKRFIDAVKQAREELQVPVSLMLDTKGPEIRTGKFENDKVELVEGQLFSLIYEDLLGNNERVPITYKELYNDVKVGTQILVSDGEIELEVVETHDRDIVCKVKNGGTLGNQKSINVPGVHLSMPFMTQKDVDDITAGCREDFDYISASFVRCKEDVLSIRKVLKDNNCENIKIISKIENKEGIDNFDEILEVTDGIMVARGDLGDEIPLEELPIWQKEFVKKCNDNGKIVVIATQMLDSMIENPRPTRAEVSDVANAIYDGAGVIMLSGETANGKYPLNCVNTMTRIANEMESYINYWDRFSERKINFLSNPDYEFELNHSAISTAKDMQAKAIFAYTDTGRTPRFVASLMPGCPIYAITSNYKTYRQLAMVWGVTPIIVDNNENPDDVIAEGIEIAKQCGYVEQGDIVILAGGSAILSKPKDNRFNQINRSIGGILKI